MSTYGIFPNFITTIIFLFDFCTSVQSKLDKIEFTLILTKFFPFIVQKPNENILKITVLFVCVYNPLIYYIILLDALMQTLQIFLFAIHVFYCIIGNRYINFCFFFFLNIIQTKSDLFYY